MGDERDDDKKEALLQKKKSTEYYEGCPGCKVDLLKDRERGFPFKGLAFIWIIVLAGALPISALFPFLYFMIQDFHIAESDEDIGFYAGFVGCSFMVGRALTSIACGVVADRYGRKPVLIIGTLSVVLFNALFGLSVNFWMALATRFFLGGLNSTLLGPIKAYACEILRDEYHALGLSAVSTSWGAGLIVGPALGGFLAQPADKYPHIFSKDSIFGRFPYLLASLAISLLAVPSFIAALWAPESLHKHGKQFVSSDESYEVLETGSSYSNAKDQGSTSKETDESTMSLFKNWPLMSSILLYCVFSLHDMAYTELFSLWVVSPRTDGGLSYTSEGVGEVLAISGAGLLIFQMSLYSYGERILGPLMITRIAAILTIPLLQAYPFMTYLSGIPLFLILNTASLIKNILSISAITGTFLLQNRVVEQKQRGAANGLALTVMSACKAIGPAVGGAIFSWAQKRHHAAFLPGDHIVFFLLNVVEFVGVVMTFKPFIADFQK